VTAQNVTDVTTPSLEYDSTWQNMTDNDIIMMMTQAQGSSKRKARKRHKQVTSLLMLYNNKVSHVRTV